MEILPQKPVSSISKEHEFVLEFYKKKKHNRHFIGNLSEVNERIDSLDRYMRDVHVLMNQRIDGISNALQTVQPKQISSVFSVSSTERLHAGRKPMKLRLLVLPVDGKKLLTVKRLWVTVSFEEYKQMDKGFTDERVDIKKAFTDCCYDVKLNMSRFIIAAPSNMKHASEVNKVGDVIHPMISEPHLEQITHEYVNDPASRRNIPEIMTSEFTSRLLIPEVMTPCPFYVDATFQAMYKVEAMQIRTAIGIEVE